MRRSSCCWVAERRLDVWRNACAVGWMLVGWVCVAREQRGSGAVGEWRRERVCEVVQLTAGFSSGCELGFDMVWMVSSEYCIVRVGVSWVLMRCVSRHVFKPCCACVDIDAVCDLVSAGVCNTCNVNTARAVSMGYRSLGNLSCSSFWFRSYVHVRQVFGHYRVLKGIGHEVTNIHADYVILDECHEIHLVCNAVAAVSFRSLHHTPSSLRVSAFLVMLPLPQTQLALRSPPYLYNSRVTPIPVAPDTACQLHYYQLYLASSITSTTYCHSPASPLPYITPSPLRSPPRPIAFGPV